MNQAHPEGRPALRTGPKGPSPPASTRAAGSVPVEEGRIPLSPEAWDRLLDRTLRFLIRGVVHRMNNVLAVFSSHAQLLGVRRPETSRREAPALQKAVARGGRVMNLLSEVLALREGVGPPGPREAGREAMPTCLGSFLRSLQEIFFCEEKGSRYGIEVEADLQVYTPLPEGLLTVAHSLSLDRLLKTLPPDLPGRVEISVQEPGPALQGAGVLFHFKEEEGHLPFPVSEEGLDPDLADFLQAYGICLERVPDGKALLLLLPSGR